MGERPRAQRDLTGQGQELIVHPPSVGVPVVPANVGAVSEPIETRCRAGGCRQSALAHAPVALCAPHLTAVVDWASAEFGVVDVLPSPCRACGSRRGVRYPSGWLCEVCEWRHGEVPDGDLAPVRVDVVYYLRAGDRIKIGTTANPRARFAALGHHDLIAFELGDRQRERRRHEQFASHRYAGSEWFATHPELEALVGALSAGADPWDRYARWCSEAAAARA